MHALGNQNSILDGLLRSFIFLQDLLKKSKSFPELSFKLSIRFDYNVGHIDQYPRFREKINS